MTNKNHVRPRSPRRFVAQSPPSILIVEQEADLRAFLRASLQRWYQVAAAPEGIRAVEHLEHCPPQGLIVGKISPSGEEVLVSTLRDMAPPPVLKIWSTCPPAGWADRALRHPFMRVDLLRAVDRLVHTDAAPRDEVEDAETNLNDVDPET